MSSKLAVSGRAFVLGHPIEHSLSPALHGAAYDFLGLDISYGRMDTVEADLPERFEQALSYGDVLGFSCTMPLKTAVKEFLGAETDFARAVGVVNTVFWRQDDAGGLVATGHNTDVSGIVNALDWAGAGASAQTPCAIVGGGGTATSAVAALKFLGAGSIDIFVRSQARAHRVEEVAQRIGVDLNFLPLDSFGSKAHLYGRVVSTLPAYAADEFVNQMNQPVAGALLDVSYEVWPSALASAWQQRGGCVVSGKDMLMYQALDQVKLFIGMNPTQQVDDELGLVNAMCAAIDLEPRDRLPRLVAESHQLITAPESTS